MLNRIVKNQVVAHHTVLWGYVSFEKGVFTFVKISLSDSATKSFIKFCLLLCAPKRAPVL